MFFSIEHQHKIIARYIRHPTEAMQTVWPIVSKLEMFFIIYKTLLTYSSISSVSGVKTEGDVSGISPGPITLMDAFR